MGAALERALRYLWGRVDEARRGRSSRRLEPLNTLAAYAGVSHVTMLAAVHVLRDAGLLSVSHRYGTRVIDAGALPPPPPPEPAPRTYSVARTPAWRQAADAVRADCERAVYAPGERLPPYKMLAERYGVCHVTLSRALKELCREGELERCGRGFRRRVALAPRPANTIVLFARGRDATEPLLSTHLDREELLALELACRRHGVVLHPVLWYFATPQQAVGADALKRFLVSHGGRNLLGCIVWDRLIPDYLRVQVNAVLLASEVPYAVLCSSGAPPGASPWKTELMFHMGGRPGDGRVVGEYLLSLCHRRVAYVHPLGTPEWSPPRAAGLKDAFARLAGRAEVIEVEPSPGTHREHVAGTIHRSLREIRTKVLRFSREAPVAGELHPHLRLIERLHSDIAYMQTAMELRTYLFPLCDRLIRMPEISAWVGANDMVALGCLDYLRLHRIPVPERISVIGFDDSEAAMARQMTSYNFNIPAYAEAMVRRLVMGGTKRASSCTTAGPIEIDGYVQVRATTGPVAQDTPEP